MQLLNITLVCFLILSYSVALCIPDMDTTLSCVTFFIVAIISQNHFIQHFIALAFIIGYNVTIGAERNQFVAIRNQTTPPERNFIVDRCLGVYGLFFFVAFLIRELITELDALTRRSQTALNITREIGAALVSYDTDVAMCALAAYKTNVDNDDDMCANMEQIIGNLETYRPFLPNYLLAVGGGEGRR
eukprot:PhM_4_TR16798/c0_g1_i1/m.50487